MKYVTRIGKARNACKILVGKALGKRTTGRLRRWEDNIKTYVREIDLKDGRLMEPAQLISWLVGWVVTNL
jgi:hypothetical protein